ncbi:MAG: S1-like domain-containing RNA-binding protein [Acholeplasmataceae bacterium]|nr:S1-like domain-containing RNA-binding protein [Acholeplasmataceae bacterium]
MSLNIGSVNKLKVIRKTDIGYMLDSDEDEVFLHFNETNHQELKPNDLVDAFLYFDQKGRLAATLKTPLITKETPGFLEATDVHSGLGVFFHMGINKDLLLSMDDLPLDYTKWPIKGDKLYLSIKVKGKLVAKIVSKEELKIAPPTLKPKDKVFAYVQKIGREGVNLLTEDLNWIFVHQSMVRNDLRLGEKVEVTITYQSEKGYTGSLIAQKEVLLFEDANMILSYLIRKGELPLTSDSTPEEIKAYFPLSKKAFKRAIGHLYKERKIDFVDQKTILVK